MRVFFVIVFGVLLQNIFAHNPSIEFKENKGQWEDNIIYKAKIPGGQLYLENTKLTYQFYNEQDILRIGNIHHGWFKNPTRRDSIINLHAFEVEFVDALQPQIQASKPYSDYENYFIGNDSSKWASDVKKYKDIEYKQLYSGIDLKLYSTSEAGLKYDFIVNPNADIEQIRLKYTGQNKLSITKNGALEVLTSVNTLIENKPYAYQIIDGKQKEVKCNFKLIDNTLSFDFPKGYDKNIPLVIDPALVFASYTGATIDNWGFTSTYDDAGNLYGGGVAFGLGYPTTVGAYQVTYNGGYTDVSITKFNPTGTNLIYSTYIGGAGRDNPHSLIVNSNNELVIFGTTQSINFPTASAYDPTFNGGYDIFVTKLSTGGNVLLGSTYLGGGADDGLNTGNPLKYNYADEFRGEVVVDANDNVYVASTTRSNNFPTTPGVIFPTYIPGEMGQNACVFKLSSNLSSLIWSTYFGGNMDDAAYSLQFDKLGNIVFTGGTKSADIPVSPTAYKDTIGGSMDGYLTKINPTATSILACTYLGTDTLDQSFFVQLDTADNIFAFGQTEGTYPITPLGVYADSNSGQFLHKLTPNLDSTIFSTTFGTGSGHVDIAPSAFLVNDCNYILVCGWGGTLNIYYGLADYSTTNGMNITSNAVQNTTDGEDYYLAMFGENADTLLYATFFGGNMSRDHVDGGTSRFDKKGMVYQSVCASCGTATNDFPTSSGAWSTTDNSTNCNMGVFKLDLTKLTAIADVYITPYYCVGETVHFQNLSVGGISYLWDFGDGYTSTAFEPYHVFDTAGTYNVMLYVLDSTSCNLMDSDFVEVYISPLPKFVVDSVPGICLGDSIQLEVTGATSCVWFNATSISDTSIFNPVVWPQTTTEYFVSVNSLCGTDTLSTVVDVFLPNISIIPDTTICRGKSVELAAYVGKSYLWTPDSTLNTDTIPNPISTPYYSTLYTVEITDINNCTWDTFMNVFVDTVLAVANVSPNQTICEGDSVQLTVSGGVNYNWTPISYFSNPTDSLPIVHPTQTTVFVVSSSNGCNTAVDSVVVTVLHPSSTVVDDTTVCAGEQVSLWATGGNSYWWEPSQLISNPSQSLIHPIITEPVLFTVSVTDSAGCLSKLTVFVDTFPKPTVEIIDTIIASWGSEIVLEPSTNAQNYNWTPPTGLSCTDCLNPFVSVLEQTAYTLEVTSIEGCKSTATTVIVVDGVLYIPNAFTPNGDGFNDIFYAFGKNIITFEMMIFDRWGEKLFTSKSLDKGWDGTYSGKIVQTETYVWKIKYTDVLNNMGEQIGTVTLIR
ncbi:MAG: gliding motility-associated C-terminal domain-containing protein [Flavobacteriales bacterium]|nr:gliding motility-associated C-terminal domain-containing protein [Flavobacteriales bacterium]